MTYQITLFQITMSDFQGHDLLQAFENMTFCTIVQQLTRFQLT